MRYLLLALLFAFNGNISAYAEVKTTPPKEALSRLIAGNKRYSEDKLKNINRDQARRESVISKQKPFAVIIGCSDSRVAPEIIFDQGIGDLFIVRVAGNVMDPVELSSIMYAIDYLQASLIVVLGHENCGAVKAVLAHQTEDIEPIAKKIEASLKEYIKNINPSIEEAVKANIKGVIGELKQVKSLKNLMSTDSVGIVGGYYHLTSGKVEICCEL